MAFGAITFYMLFSAPGAPTQRSWLMTGIVLFAVCIDRTAITMRLVAWAAFVVLLLLPESMMGPSFQMSFAAVVALIALWEAARDKLAQWREGRGWFGRAAVALVGATLTSLVAGFATAPFALYPGSPAAREFRQGWQDGDSDSEIARRAEALADDCRCATVLIATFNQK